MEGKYNSKSRKNDQLHNYILQGKQVVENFEGRPHRRERPIPKIAPSPGGIQPPPNTWFLEPIRAHIPKGTTIGLLS